MHELGLYRLLELKNKESLARQVTAAAVQRAIMEVLP